MSDDVINELLDLAEQVKEPPADEDTQSTQNKTVRRKSTKTDENQAWGKKKRDELVMMVLNDIVRKLNEIKYVASSPVVRKDVDEIYKDLVLLKRLLLE